MNKVISNITCKHLIVYIFLHCHFFNLSAENLVKADIFLQNAAEIDISGRVTDESGIGLPGVTVLVEGTEKGTITDVEGNYMLSVDENATITYSFIGFITQRVSVNGRSIINVLMVIDQQKLEEVVVIGYGVRNKGELTGAITEVNKNYLSQQPVANVTQALQGSASGITIIGDPRPGYNAEVRIRGLGTINNNAPLYVVDGVNSGSIPPTDQIESIQILKDASSTAIYGARGANGVILINTKLGKKDQKPKIDITFRTGIKQSIAEFDIITDPKKVGEMFWLEQLNDGVNPTHPQFTFTEQGRGLPPIIELNDYLFPIGGGIGDPSVDPELYDQWMYPITRSNPAGTEWIDEIFQNAVNQNLSLGFTGGSEKTQYAVNGSYVRDKGVMKFSDYNLVALRSNIDTNIKDWLKIGQRLGFRWQEYKGNTNPSEGQESIRQVIEMSPLFPVRDIAGNYAGGRGNNLSYGPNPLAVLDREKTDNTVRLNTIGNFYAQISPVKDLSIKSLFGFNLTSSSVHNRGLAAPEDTYGNLTNNLRESRSFNATWNWSNTISFAKNIGGHSFELLMGTEANESKNNGLNGFRDNFGFTDDDFYVLVAGDGSTSTNGGINDVGYTLFSVFGRTHYVFNERYIFDFTVRRDGSSRFGENNRFGTFPAVSLGWNINRETFMTATSSWLTYLKLRGSWGQSGNDRVGNYNSHSFFNQGPSNSYYPIDGSDNSLTLGYQAFFTGNENGKWETTTSLNFAIDATFFGQLDITLDLWQKNTSDMLYPLPVPQVLGRNGQPSVNIGNMENKGLDITLDYNGAAIAGDLKYSISGTFTHYNTKITKLSGIDGEFIAGNTYGRDFHYTIAEAGHPFPVFFGYLIDGIFQTQEEADVHAVNGTYNEPGNLMARDVNGDGEISPDDRTYIGNPHPNFTSGLNMTLEYKGFDLGISLYTSIGNDVVNWYNRFTKFGLSIGPSHPDRLNKSWGSYYLVDNKDAILPKASASESFEQNPSTMMIEDGSYLRLQNIQLGYNLPSSITSKFDLTKFRVYIMGANLFTITGYSGLNPEVMPKFSTTGLDAGQPSGIDRGIDTGTWPMPRTFMIGIDISL